MDTDRFDSLTKQLAQTPSRRHVLQGLGGGLVAGVLAALGRGEALADLCKADGKTCKKNSQCCSGFCQGGTVTGSTAGSSGVCAPPCTANEGSCSANTDCCSGICQSGTCVATVAGTCAAGSSVCTAINGNSGICGDGCLCFQTEAGDTICAGTATCVADCSACGAAETCVVGCCGSDTPFRCVTPCGPSGGNLGGCFTGETRIALADGTSTPIDLVAVGDLVLGHGRVNRVLGVHRPRLGAQPLYALNGGPAFVTANHPLLTEAGWTAIDPAAAMAARPTVAVRRLTVGDRLLTLAALPVSMAAGHQHVVAGQAAPHLAATALDRIAAVVADPATPLYDLRVDGDHTYFANDLLVHNK